MASANRSRLITHRFTLANVARRGRAAKKRLAASRSTGGKMRITANVADAKKLGHALTRAIEE
jgi:hypothetical protein